MDSYYLELFSSSWDVENHDIVWSTFEKRIVEVNQTKRKYDIFVWTPWSCQETESWIKNTEIFSSEIFDP